MQHYRYHVKVHGLNVVEMGRKGVSEQMCRKFDLFALCCLQDKTMTEETQTCVDRYLCNVLLVVLKQIGTRRCRTRCWVSVGIVRNGRKTFSGLQVVMLLEQVSNAFQVPSRFSPHDVICWFV